MEFELPDTWVERYLFIDAAETKAIRLFATAAATAERLSEVR